MTAARYAQVVNVKAQSGAVNSGEDGASGLASAPKVHTLGMYMAEIQFEWTDSNTNHIARHGFPRQAKCEGGVLKKKKALVMLDAPRFCSEAEGAEWWDSHQDLGAELLLKHGCRAAIPSKSIAVRIPVTDIEKARQLAEAKGIGYQTLIKVLF